MVDVVRVHQFTPTITTADGVSQGVFFTQRLLRELGFFTTIYADNIDDALKGRVLHIDEYQPSSQSILLYHHSIGHDHHELIMSFPDRKVLVYHNITPSRFFKGSEHLQRACDWGREQLASGLPFILNSYADSQYNADELISVGYHNPAVIPLLVDIEYCLSRSSKANGGILEPDVFNILFIGRIVSNKCQHQIIDVLYALEEIVGKGRVKLHLVGGVSEPEYMDFIQAHINALGLNSSIDIVGRASHTLLYDYMKSADLFLCLSDHEGFCMPILESICCDLPVLAYKAGGIETALGAAGLLNDKSSGYIADKIAAFIENRSSLEVLRNSQRSHLNKFKPECLKLKLLDVIKANSAENSAS